MARHPLATLALLAVLAFVLSLGNPPVFDDVAFLVNNRWLRWEFVGNFFRSAIPTSDLGFIGYRPLVMLSFAAEREWFPGVFWLPRLTNLLLHFGVAVLLFLNARRILRSESAALFAASFFLLHPVQTNVIALLWKRSDLLVATGILSTLHFSRKWIERDSGGWGSLAAAHFSAMVALFSKESALILPGALLLAERLLWRKPRFPGFSRLLLYGPLLLAISAHAWIVFVKIPEALSLSGFRGSSFMPPSLALGRVGYFLTQGAAFLEYLRITFWPLHLRVFHDIPPVFSPLDPRFFASATIVVTSTLGALSVRKSRPAISFGILFFLLLLIPSSSFVPLHLPFDEDRLYLPIAGVSLIAASLGDSLLGRFRLPVALLLFTAFVAADVNRLSQWRDPVGLWAANAETDPEDPRPWLNLGEALRSEGEFPLAAAAFKRAATLDPSYPLPWLYLGMLHAESGSPDRAEESLRKAFEKGPFPWDVTGQLGIVAARRGDPGKAARYFSMSLEVHPEKGVTFRNYAGLLDRNGEPSAAARARAIARFLEGEGEFGPDWLPAKGYGK